MGSVEHDEREHDRNEARREEFMPTYEEALEDLFGKIMDGKEYPRHVHSPQVNRIDILADDSVDKSELAELVNMFMTGTLSGEDAARQRVKKIVRRHLEGDGRHWVELRQRDMADEAEEAGRE